MGYKVYKEVCSACHSLNLVAFRNLGRSRAARSGIAKYPNPNENPVVKSIAKDAYLGAGRGHRQRRRRSSVPRTSADYFTNRVPQHRYAARAANGGAAAAGHVAARRRPRRRRRTTSIRWSPAMAPTPPPGLTIPDGKYYDPWLSGDLSAPTTRAIPTRRRWAASSPCPPPLVDNRVSFDDGTKATLNEEAWDVAAFLQWASDPKLDERKELGVEVLIFLLVFTGLLYASYRAIWRNVGH